jgi:hypothetical protein
VGFSGSRNKVIQALRCGVETKLPQLIRRSVVVITSSFSEFIVDIRVMRLNVYMSHRAAGQFNRMQHAAGWDRRAVVDVATEETRGVLVPEPGERGAKF